MFTMSETEISRALLCVSNVMFIGKYSFFFCNHSNFVLRDKLPSYSIIYRGTVLENLVLNLIFFLSHTRTHLYKRLCVTFFCFSQMKSTTVLYRYNDISRKNGFYSLNIRHAAITGAIYTLVSTIIRIYIHSYGVVFPNRYFHDDTM